MSSNPAYATILPAEMEMIQTVLDDAGYDADVLAEDQSLFNAAALLVMKLFLAGETSPYALSAQLERNFGAPTKDSAPYKPPLPRFAIQGLPMMPGRETPTLFYDPDLQSWDNEGGAVSRTRTRSTYPLRRMVRGKGPGNV
ncbi:MULTISPECIES: hypothetical protein [unclassified Ensifer]|uniref:hypothetical protein n=1 Tax=unclassified Ensifer TaxID=2633371 RepID=UPI00081340F1|nr:hypothetical protein BC363_29245 [Ensifer sp. LC384]OCP21221.1 hypothetical protein BC361_27165 [Ensifer sp. LC54]